MIGHPQTFGYCYGIPSGWENTIYYSSFSDNQIEIVDNIEFTHCDINIIVVHYCVAHWQNNNKINKN